MHFSVLVIGENYEELMEQYGPDSVGELLETREDIESKLYEEFINLDKSAIRLFEKDPDKFSKMYKGQSRFCALVSFYNKLKNKSEKDTKEFLYNTLSAHLFDESIKVRPDGVYDYGITEWDWYEIGGRWAGSLIQKDLIKRDNDVGFSWGYSVGSMVQVLSNNCTDQAKKGDIINLKSLLRKNTYAILSEGEGWVELGSCGDLVDLVNEIMSYPDDTLITYIDCHI